MTLLRLVGTVLWACVLLVFGGLALTTGDGWAWTLFLICLGLFVTLALVSQRPHQSAVQR